MTAVVPILPVVHVAAYIIMAAASPHLVVCLSNSPVHMANMSPQTHTPSSPPCLQTQVYMH